MIDTHCHVDLYPQPTNIAKQADQAGILTIIVTNLPSAFERAQPHIRSFKNMRLALGLHPLAAEHHRAERDQFTKLIDQTSYIGEIGLDFSRAGFATKDLQVESLRFLLKALDGKPKFITLHSRQAEAQVLDILDEANRSQVVFHWFSGPLKALERALDKGHFFSLNPAMIQSPNGKKIIDSLPPDRVLTESDGPFVQIGNRTVLPSDVAVVEEYLAGRWSMKTLEVRAKIRENFLEVIKPLRQQIQIKK